ncbi:shikimate dehydrogenase family protein [Robiginitalea aurantiaca]|uniref:Shikimate dehydrogenase n=1 Tax=Robiginitalea aurantiaca TaxID=3056915 RepID=A0ABT7WGH9_9FLAO|nr:shikimate dehydrogenase [Robiginitalea aurantiaca]MDM9632028.1 shikimate dehydrogenase [Robiginitalea aurantiaca]
MRRFGLIGKDISYSFSPGYFSAKFESLGLKECSYEIFDLPEISGFSEILSQPDLCGLNVTIPYKTAICSFMDRLDPDAAEIGAVNTIRFTRKGLVGYNTDVIGFTRSLSPMLYPEDTAALILGTGGASKAVAYGLTKLGIRFRFVSRSAKDGALGYADLNQTILNDYQLIINCTPCGTYPRVDEAPPIPYDALNTTHLLYDLIYNPEKTAFLKKGSKAGCRVKNGLEMLHLQAEASWEIWNTEPTDLP